MTLIVFSVTTVLDFTLLAFMGALLLVTEHFGNSGERFQNVLKFITQKTKVPLYQNLGLIFVWLRSVMIKYVVLTSTGPETISFEKNNNNLNDN